MKQTQFKSFDYSIKGADIDASKGIVTGYFAAFNNKDSDGDIIVKGAFAKTIKERGPQSSKPRIKHLLDHGSRQNQSSRAFIGALRRRLWFKVCF
jgi:phage head maturation protease